ncbi:TrfA [Pseudomonas veronii]|nr:TrfA [Pseudomonas veronii]
MQETVMTDLTLNEEEVRLGLIDDRRVKLQQKFEIDSGQGILPFTNERFFEQSNPILRSALFSVGKMGARDRTQYLDWTEIFSLGNGSILYRGPALTVDHETVLGRIMVLARGRSLTKPVHAYQADVLRWLYLDPNSGANYKKARIILDDLAAAEVRINSKPALRRLLNLLTSPSISDLPDGKFFQEYIKNRYGDQIKMIAMGLENDQPVHIDMQFLQNQTHNSATGKMMLNLDPIAALFFDGVNTTLLPFEILDKQDRFGRKLLPFIASHRDGVFPIRLESYHEFSGSKSAYASVKRRVKSELKKRFEGWVSEGLLCAGWEIYRNNEGEEIVRGLKLGEIARIKSSLASAGPNPSEDCFGEVDDDVIEERVNQFADMARMERPAPVRRKART